MAFWLLKTEPQTYSWDQLVKDKKTLWTGVRSYQARNNLRLMKPGDMAFIYHSGDEKLIVGIARIAAEAVPEKTEDAGEWVAPEIEAVMPLARELSLDEIKSWPMLAEMAFVRQGRLSVSPVTEAQAKKILEVTKTEI